MSENAWLKQVLADAKAAKESWPEWAKTSTQTELNSHPNHQVCSITARDNSGPAAVKQQNQTNLGAK